MLTTALAETELQFTKMSLKSPDHSTVMEICLSSDSRVDIY